MQPSTIRSLVLELIGERALSCEAIGEGRNSRVFRVECAGPNRYAAKFYGGSVGRRTDRLAAEFDGLEFLWREGERAIPCPVACDPSAEFALYEYVDGVPLRSSHVTESDIDDATAFLLRLRALASSDGSDRLPPAAEACFSFDETVANIRSRLNRLLELRETEGADDLQTFLVKEFVPVLEGVSRWCASSLDDRGMSCYVRLSPMERTLSPSDFGFHNSLRRSNGQVVYLDFEYFGWDDPAKLISDFLLHPAMDLPVRLRRRFFRSMVSGFEKYGPVGERVRIVYPLFGLKWCLILLNEFVPRDFRRREFSKGHPLNCSEVQSEQLAKARAMLKKVRSELNAFPFAG